MCSSRNSQIRFWITKKASKSLKNDWTNSKKLNNRQNRQLQRKMNNKWAHYFIRPIRSSRRVANRIIIAPRCNRSSMELNWMRSKRSKRKSSNRTALTMTAMNSSNNKISKATNQMKAMTGGQRLLEEKVSIPILRSRLRLIWLRRWATNVYSRHTWRKSTVVLTFTSLRSN